jgi:invasion protein IalB
MIELMRKSSQAKISATSAKGSKTIDTFSLSGFGDAYEAAKKKCNFI